MRSVPATPMRLALPVFAAAALAAAHPGCTDAAANAPAAAPVERTALTAPAADPEASYWRTPPSERTGPPPRRRRPPMWPPYVDEGAPILD